MSARFQSLLSAMLAACLLPVAAADNLSSLGVPPYWPDLDEYQRTMTRDEFLSALETVYSDPLSYKSSMAIGDDHASILRTEGDPTPYQLEFATTGGEIRTPPRYWRPASSLPPAEPLRPLSELKIAIDPGHIGGEWAKMEERSFQIGEDQEIREGELTLIIAEILQQRLENLGAEVTLVREKFEPVTAKRPIDFRKDARLFLLQNGVRNPLDTYLPTDRANEGRVATIQWQSEKLFYRTSEIRERALRVNEEIVPDLVLCLHLNAEAWGDPAAPEYVDSNHLHILMNGSYMFGELGNDDVRFEMVTRLLERTHDEELRLATHLAPSMAESTGLPPYVYPGQNATPVEGQPYLYRRNLLANRTYRCPVIYFEPYVMNNEEVASRLALGDYLGKTLVGDELRTSIYQDYVNGVVTGLVSYYSEARPK